MSRVSSISTRIHGDRLEGALNHEWSIDAPSLDDLDSAMDRLDARIYTTLIIAASGQEHMAIGGGDGRYIVYWTRDNEDFKVLVRPEAEESAQLVNVGGQPADYPAKQIVDITQARAAAHLFFLRQQLDPAQTWETN
jgi:hypothetical protein